MVLSKLSSEDLSKIHSEVNQIVHQRFLLCTAAITLFGVVIAWLFPKEPPQSGSSIGWLTFCVTTLLSGLLFSLFVLHISLKRTIRVLTSYLIVTDSSKWEKDFKRFRKNQYSVYTGPQTVIFVILNIATMFFPYVLGLMYSLKREPTWGVHIQFIVGFVTLLFMCGMGFWHWFDNEEAVTKRWKALLCEKNL